MAIDKERTRHHGCTGWNFINLREVYASCLHGSFLLLVGLIGMWSLRRRWCRVDASWLSARVGEVAGSSTIVAGILSKSCWRRSRSSDVPLGLRWPIVLRPQSVLWLARSWYKLCPLWECRVSHLRALRSTTGGSSCDFTLPLFQMM